MLAGRAFVTSTLIAVIQLAIPIGVAQAATSAYKGPGYVDPATDKHWGSLTAAQKKKENQTLFARYCTGTAESPDVPGVNYKNAEVKKAAQILSGVEYNAFYFYGGPAAAYGLKKKKFDLYLDKKNNVLVWVGEGADVPSDVKKRIDSGDIEAMSSGKKTILYDDRANAKPAAVTDVAHVFLLQLCGEYRDRASMIESKVNWVQRLIKLPAKKQTKFNPKKDLWNQMAAESYGPFLQKTNAIWNLKKFVLNLNSKSQQAGGGVVFETKDYGLDMDFGSTVTFGKETQESPVPAMTVCETRYLFNDYVAGGKDLSFFSKSSADAATESIKAYSEGYKDFTAKNCTADDLAYYYDYRGDSNLKHYTPESNGMIWQASSVAGNCESPKKSKVDSLTDSDCEAYFSAPFSSRWSAARAGLGAWTLYAEDKDAHFRNDNSLVVMRPQDEKGSYIDPLKNPFSYSFDKTSKPFSLSEALSDTWQKIKSAWGKPDAAFIQYTSFGPSASEDSKAFVFNRLRNSVNRHTNWYQSGFDDGRGLQRDQAYSPLVASSYEPSKSDAFTAPGYTVQGDGDGRKYWMYVFRVPVKNLQTTLTVKRGDVFDFDTAWYDETSLGDTSLADSERAFDRLGTPLEGEFDSILYIHNILQDGGTDDDHGVPLVYEKN